MHIQSMSSYSPVAVHMTAMFSALSPYQRCGLIWYAAVSFVRQIDSQESNGFGQSELYRVMQSMALSLQHP